MSESVCLICDLFEQHADHFIVLEHVSPLFGTIAKGSYWIPMAEWDFAYFGQICLKPFWWERDIGMSENHLVNRHEIIKESSFWRH